MKSDLSKVKVGDSIWTIQEGWCKVENITNDDYPIETKNKSFNLDGKWYKDHQHPSAFLTNPFEVVAKEYLVGDNDKTHSRKKGIVLNGIFYVESGWAEWAEIIQQPIELTLEERIARLENELKKIKK